MISASGMLQGDFSLQKKKSAVHFCSVSSITTMFGELNIIASGNVTVAWPSKIWLRFQETA